MPRKIPKALRRFVNRAVAPIAKRGVDTLIGEDARKSILSLARSAGVGRSRKARRPKRRTPATRSPRVTDAVSAGDPIDYPRSVGEALIPTRPIINPWTGFMSYRPASVKVLTRTSGQLAINASGRAAMVFNPNSWIQHVGEGTFTSEDVTDWTWTTIQGNTELQTAVARFRYAGGYAVVESNMPRDAQPGRVTVLQYYTNSDPDSVSAGPNNGDDRALTKVRIGGNQLMTGRGLYIPIVPGKTDFQIAASASGMADTASVYVFINAAEASQAAAYNYTFHAVWECTVNNDSQYFATATDNPIYSSRDVEQYLSACHWLRNRSLGVILAETEAEAIEKIDRRLAIG